MVPGRDINSNTSTVAFPALIGGSNMSANFFIGSIFFSNPFNILTKLSLKASSFSISSTGGHTCPISFSIILLTSSYILAITYASSFAKNLAIKRARFDGGILQGIILRKFY